MEKMNKTDFSDLFDLKNKVAVITGGYSYLGAALANALILSGCIVYVAGKSRQKFNSIFKSSGRAKKLKFIELDISKLSSISSAFNQIYNIEKRFDILVNNAVFVKKHHAEQIDEEAWKYTIEGVLTGTLRCVNSAIPILKKNGFGNIINIGSMYGMVAPDFKIYKEAPDFFNPPAYSASKAGIIGLTRYYASYLAKYNIRVNCISPGAFPNHTAQKNRKFIKELKDRIPLNRVGQPKDLSGIIVLLASDASSYITGQNITIDGGQTIS